ncbi:MFS multidrug transporter [Pseudohyphozyma bogoriensis]|nr:MFS multidrug transporter [Pseudohyphozyma bogoriensis]
MAAPSPAVTLVEEDVNLVPTVPAFLASSPSAAEQGLTPDLKDPKDTLSDSDCKTAPYPTLPAGLRLEEVPKSTYLILSFTSEPIHPADPLSWSVKRRYWITAVAALLGLNTALAGSTPSGAAPFIKDRFGSDVNAFLLTTFLFGYVAATFICAPLSEAFGRRNVFIWSTLGYTAFSGACIAAPSWQALLALRFMSGLFGAVPPTGCGAVCGDIWNAKDRSIPLAWFSVATFAGPAVGPVMGSFSAARIDWRYPFIFLTIISAVILLITVLSCPETYPLKILTPIAQDLRTSTGDERIVSRLELAALEAKRIEMVEGKLGFWKAEVKRIVGTPILMLVQEPVVMLVTGYMMVTYGLVFLLFVAYPIIFSDLHGLEPGYASLPFLSTIGGALISFPLTLLFQKRYLREIANNGGVATPEMRLAMCEYGGALCVFAFIWLGWTGYKVSVPVALPALAGIPQGVASIFIFRSLQIYLIDTYERNAASATAAAVVCRSLAGATFPLFAEKMFVKLGVNWACTVLAGMMLVFVPVPYFFAKYGPRLRKNSKWASGR